MVAKIFNSFILAVFTGLLWFANFKYPGENLEKLFYTSIALTVIYFVFMILEEITDKKIKESKTKYLSKKVFSILYYVVLIAITIGIWVKNPQALLVSYGLVAAGVAISLQDFFKNFVGGLVVFLSGTYRVGDRIEINSKTGDVIDIGIMYTTLMEIKEWVEGDQATGRLATIPNSQILTNNVINYTKDHDFIWDEIHIPITYTSNWKKARDLILKIVKKEVQQITTKAEKNIASLEEKYYLPKKVIEPNVFMKLTDNWISLYVRYTSEVRERRVLHNTLSTNILKEIEKNKDITIASATFDVVGLPEVKIKKK